MKQLVRLLVTSSTYRQSSNARPELAAKDPENTLLARQSRLRLPAELIRDEALSAAGLLDPRIGGRSVKPPQPKGVAELAYAGSVKWDESSGPDRYRRGLYIHFQRIFSIIRGGAQKAAKGPSLGILHEFTQYEKDFSGHSPGIRLR